MIKSNELRGKIVTKHKTLAKGAKAFGMSKAVLYNIINGSKLPNSDEISRIGRACDMTAEDIKYIFLS